MDETWILNEHEEADAQTAMFLIHRALQNNALGAYKGRLEDGRYVICIGMCEPKEGGYSEVVPLAVVGEEYLRTITTEGGKPYGSIS